MRKGWLLLGALALGGLVAWWATRSDPAEQAIENTGASNEAGAGPVLKGEDARPQPIVAEAPKTEARAGICSIRGTVTKDGAPVEGATVEVRDLGNVMTDMRSLMQPVHTKGPPLASTTSADDGSFRIDGLPAGSYQLRAFDAGGAVAWTRAFCRTQQPAFRTVLRLYGGDEILEARARYGDGRPFSGLVSAGVQSRTLSNWLPEVETDAQGRFRITGLKPGPLSLNFIDVGVTRSSFDVTIPIAAGHEFIVDEGFVKYAGSVIADDTEEPLAGALIAYDSSAKDKGRRHTSSTVSDDKGKFELLMPAPVGSMWVDKEGFERLQTSTKEDQPIVFRLKRRGLVTGRVLRKSDGSPVAGVAVHGGNWYTFGLKYPLDVSKDDGTFEAVVGPGKGMLYALGNGWLSEGLSTMKDRSVNPLTLEVGQGASKTADLIVVRGGAIEGVVRDESGALVAGAAVTAELPLRTWRGFKHRNVSPGERTVATDEGGRFRIGNLVPEFPYSIVARPPDGLPGRSEPTPVESGQTRQVEVRIPAARWLPVRVIEKGTGTPVEGANVSARQAGHGSSGTTDADGVLRLGPLLPADLRVSAYHSDFLRPGGAGPFGGGGTALADPGLAPQTHVIELERGAFLAGTVYNVDGEPRDSGMLGVFAVGQKAKGYGLSGMVPMKKGAFRLGPVPLGTYDLVLVEQTTGFSQRQTCRWTVDAGGEDHVLRVDPSLEETDDDVTYLDVKGPDGKPANGFVRVLSRTGVVANGPFLQEGRYEVRGVAKGTPVWIDIRSATDAARNKLADVLHGPIVLEPGTLPIRLEAAPSVRGSVVGPDGAPRAGILIYQLPAMPDDVAVAGSTFASPAVRTDAKGKFALPGMKAAARLLVTVPDDIGLQPPIPVSPDQREVEIRLRAGATLDVTVTDTEGVALASAEVTVLLAEDLAKRTAQTNDDGVARLKGLIPGGAYVLRVGTPPGRSDLCKYVHDGWRAAGTTIVLPTGRRVEGHVVSGSGPVPYASVFWKDASDSWHREIADNRGAFQITVPSGPVVLVGGPNMSNDPKAGGPEVRLEAGAKSVRLSVK